MMMFKRKINYGVNDDDVDEVPANDLDDGAVLPNYVNGRLLRIFRTAGRGRTGSGS